MGGRPTSGTLEGIRNGERDQVLLGATGTGKTLYGQVEQTQRPAIILAPSKTLAAQLYGEFKVLPENADRILRSYDYASEAYVARSDTSSKSPRLTNRPDAAFGLPRLLGRAGRDHRLCLVHLRHRIGRNLWLMTQDIPRPTKSDQRKSSPFDRPLIPA
jgi:hypothetical protein